MGLPKTTPIALLEFKFDLWVKIYINGNYVAKFNISLGLELKVINIYIYISFTGIYFYLTHNLIKWITVLDILDKLWIDR